MDSFRKLDILLKGQDFSAENRDFSVAEAIARSFVTVDHCIAVVSDLRTHTSRIFAGEFADKLGLQLKPEENSIWEHEILSRLPEEDQEEKFLAELRFFHFLKRIPRRCRRHYYMASKLRFTDNRKVTFSILHRMYYLYSTDGETVEYAVCLYGPLTFDIPGKSIAVNSITGIIEPLTDTGDSEILSRREKQVLRLISEGNTSAEIADRLSISCHTVARHRQQILGKLNVKNSAEALHVGRSLRLL